MPQKIPSRNKVKRLLVLGAGLYHVRALEKIRAAGFHVIACDKNPNAPGARVAHEFLAIDIVDSEAVCDWIKNNPVDGVMPLNEFGMRTHARAVELFDLPGISPKAAENVIDKAGMREVWQHANLTQPQFEVFQRRDEAIASATRVGYPCVMKPSDSGGSGRGVLIVDNEHEVLAAYDFAVPHARNGKIIVEEFINGTEITVEGLCYQGHHTILTWSDKYKPPLKTRVATSLNYPAHFDAKIYHQVEVLVAAAIRALRIDCCATHTEIIITESGKPYLVELGARGGGGHIFSTIIEAVCGVNMPVELAKMLTGQAPHLLKKHYRGACYRFFNPPTGKIRAIKGIEEVRKMPGVLDIGMTKEVGNCINLLINSQERAGHVITTGENRQKAWELANLIEEKMIHIQVE